MGFNDPRFILLDESEAGKMLGFTVKGMQNRRWKGQPPAYVKVGGRHIRYKLADIMAFIDENTIRPVTE